jgi:5-methylcytosine-specific restriction endonuclease McrA
MKPINFQAREVRNEAKISRIDVLLRARGHCELCGDHQPFTLECHHVKPVKNGGDSTTSNLLALCPNCHAITEKMKGEAVNNPHFHDWVRNRYGEDGYVKFESLFGRRWGNETDKLNA